MENKAPRLSKYVYHCSPLSDVKTLNTRVGTHGKAWVYATKEMVMSAVFLGREGGDFTCMIGRNKDGIVYITERFKGAFDLRYKESGSIYKLSSKGFLENKTSWNEEVVSPAPVKVLEEIAVKDVREYLKGLEKEKRLIIAHYPERYMLPENDTDLVSRGIEWTVKAKNQEAYLKNIAKYQPGLIDRIKEGLRAKGDYKNDS